MAETTFAKIGGVLGQIGTDHAAEIVNEFGIPSTFINRQRSLSSTDRANNRMAVISLVMHHCSQDHADSGG